MTEPRIATTKQMMMGRLFISDFQNSSGNPPFRLPRAGLFPGVVVFHVKPLADLLDRQAAFVFLPSSGTFDDFQEFGIGTHRNGFHVHSCNRNQCSNRLTLFRNDQWLAVQFTGIVGKGGCRLVEGKLFHKSTSSLAIMILLPILVPTART